MTRIIIVDNFSATYNLLVYYLYHYQVHLVRVAVVRKVTVFRLIMRVQVRIISNAFRIFGFFPSDESGTTKKCYAFFTTGLLFVLLGGICAETYLWNEKSGSRILPITYALCTMHALTKRLSIFYCRNTIRELIEYMGDPFRYNDERMNYESISARLIRLINRALTAVHLVLFISAYISPFSSLVVGQRLMYSRIMYPIFVPWRVDNLAKYAVTYLLEALLVYPALAGIYVYSVFAVFSTTTFKNEMDKVQKAITTLESRCSQHYEYPYDRMYFINLRECIIHYQIIRR